MQSQNKNTIEKIYDTYSPALYGIALEISTTEKEAEEIIIGTFLKLHKSNSSVENSHCIFVTLIKLLLATAREQIKLKRIIKLKLFKNSPLLQKIVCENLSVKTICGQFQLTIAEVLQRIREEFNQIRNNQPIVNQTAKKSVYV